MRMDCRLQYIWIELFFHSSSKLKLSWPGLRCLEGFGFDEGSDVGFEESFGVRFC